MNTTTRVNAVEERLRALSPEHAESRYRWPSLAEIVKVTVPQNDRERYECWKKVGAGTIHRQTQTSSIPRVIFENLPAAAWHPRSVGAHFSLTHAIGQEDDVTRRNLIVAFEPTWNYVQGGGAQELKWPGMWAEIGCAHDYETLAEGNCYRKARCRKCGHQWARDSGD